MKGIMKSFKHYKTKVYDKWSPTTKIMFWLAVLAISLTVIFGVLSLLSNTSNQEISEDIVKTRLGHADRLLEGGMTKDALEIYIDLLEKVSEKNYPEHYAHIKSKEGRCYLNLVLMGENQEDNIKKAILAFEDALKIYTDEEYPFDYGNIQNDIGNSYYILAEIRNREDNLEKAILAFEKALKVYRNKRLVQTIDIGEGIKLGIYKVEEYVNYAGVQVGLGNAYSSLAEVRDKKNNLEKAIDAYKYALDVYTIDKHPSEYAAAQNNLGIAYFTIAEFQDIWGKLNSTQKAILAIEEALKVYTVENDSLRYADAKNNLGLAYTTRGKFVSGEGNIEKAINAFEDALKVYSFEENPDSYAGAKSNRGAAYPLLANSRDKEENLEKAILDFEDALRVYNIKDYPIKYALNQYNIGLAHKYLATYKNKEENLEKAISAFEESLKIYTPENYPDWHNIVKLELEKAKQQREL